MAQFSACVFNLRWELPPSSDRIAAIYRCRFESGLSGVAAASVIHYSRVRVRLFPCCRVPPKASVEYDRLRATVICVFLVLFLCRFRVYVGRRSATVLSRYWLVPARCRKRFSPNVEHNATKGQRRATKRSTNLM